MRRLELRAGGGCCVILVGACLESLPEFLGGKPAFAVTDARVRQALGSRFPELPYIEVPEGEEGKSLSTLEKIHLALLSAGADRSWTLLGIGGGLVCDLSGFAAATYMRGIRSGMAPTTLLAQLDASVGGKNGVNVDGIKNLVGTIRQPDFVLADPSTLGSLRPLDFRAGFAEAVKHGAIASEEHFSYLEANAEAALRGEPAVLERIVADSIAIKSRFVEADEREAGGRALLNLGHTLGHGIEIVLGLRHGEAVALGMMAAYRLGLERGTCGARDAERAESLLSAFGLPTRLPAPSSSNLVGTIVAAILKDKKRSGGRLRFVFPGPIGSASLGEIELEALAEAARRLLS